MVDPVPKQDEQGVQSVFDAALQHIQSKDWDSWVSLYSEDCVFHPPNEPAVRGRQALRAWGESFAVEKMVWTDFTMNFCGDLAYGTSAVTMKLEGVKELQAKQLVVFRRIENRWMAVAVSFNSDDVPLPET